MGNTEVAAGADLEEFLRDEVERAVPRGGSERRRMAVALLLSLLAHLPLLGLTFGGDGSGLPGFTLPWQSRRIEAPDLRVFLLPARVDPEQPAVATVADPEPPARVEPPAKEDPAARIATPVADAKPETSPAPPEATRSRTTVALVPQADAVSDPVVGPVPSKPTEPAEPPRDEAPAPVADRKSVV